MRYATALSIIAATLSASPVFARWDFKLVQKGQHKAGGQICFIRFERTATADPARMFFTSDAVHCLPADDLIDLPPFPFMLYATHPDGYVSRTMEMLVPAPGDKAADNEDCLTPFDIEVVPSATVDLRRVSSQLRPGEFLAAWTSDTADARSMIYPATPGSESLLVPANRPFVILKIGQRRPLRVSNALQLAPREVLAFEFDEKAGTDVITWASVDRQFLAKEVQRRSKFGAIKAVLVASDGKRYESLFPMLHGANIHGTLQIFKDVPAGKARIVAEGPLWTAQEVILDVPDTGVALAGPLAALPAATVAVTYSAASHGIDYGSGVQTCGTLDEAPDAPAALQLVLQRCSDADCEDVITRLLPHPSGVEDLTNIPIGSYRVQLRYGADPLAVEEFSPRPNQALSMTVRGQLVGIHGRITRRDEPVNAKVAFATGHAVSDPTTGRYAVVLSREPDRNLIDIHACDGSFRYTHIPDTPPEPGKAFDIAVPFNELRVKVVDGADSSALPNARVRYAIMKPGSEDSAIFTRSGKPDAKGEVAYDSVPQDRPLQICGQAEGYRSRCIDTSPLKKDERRNVLLTLAKEGRWLGSVIAPMPLERATLFRVERGGRVAVEVDVRPDGAFSFDRPPSSNEYYVVVSANLPLYVVAAAELPKDDTDFRIVLPPAPTRSFLVSTSEAISYALGIAVDDHPVPTSALSLHQGWRGRLHYIARGGPLAVDDIAETGRITVLRGPEIDRYPRNLQPGLDVFSAPEYASTLLREEMEPGMRAITFK